MMVVLQQPSHVWALLAGKYQGDSDGGFAATSIAYMQASRRGSSDNRSSGPPARKCIWPVKRK